MSHSNGSVHHGWVLKDAPELVRRSTFVDPVVFSLWEGGGWQWSFPNPRRLLQLLLPQAKEGTGDAAVLLCCVRGRDRKLHPAALQLVGAGDDLTSGATTPSSSRTFLIPLHRT